MTQLIIDQTLDEGWLDSKRWQGTRRQVSGKYYAGFVEQVAHTCRRSCTNSLIKVAVIPYYSTRSSIIWGKSWHENSRRRWLCLTAYDQRWSSLGLGFFWWNWGCLRCREVRWKDLCFGVERRDPPKVSEWPRTVDHLLGIQFQNHRYASRSNRCSIKDFKDSLERFQCHLSRTI